MKRTEKKGRRLHFYWAAVATFFLACVMMVWTASPALAATALTWSADPNIGLSYTADGECGFSVNDSTVVGTAKTGESTDGCGTTYTARNATLSITNNYTDDATLSFQYETTGSGTVTVGGNPAGSSNVSYLLPVGATYEISVTSMAGGSDTTTITISNLQLKPAIGPYHVTVNMPAEGGTVSVDGTPIDAAWSTAEAYKRTPIQLAAVPAEGYVFAGWIDDDLGTYLSKSASYEFAAAKDTAITPFFVKSDGTAAFMSGNLACYDINDAVIAALTTGYPAVLVADYTALPGNYTIPSGVTILAPYSADGTSVDNGTSDSPYANWNGTTSSTEAMDPESGLYLTLGISQGATVNVEAGGKLVIGGTINGGSANSNTGAGGTCGPHSNMQLDGTVNVAGIFSTCGYVLGSGTLNTQTGGTVYEPYIVKDFHGGSWTLASNSAKVLPFLRYSMENIRVAMNIRSDATLYGYCDLYASGGHNKTCAKIISASDSILNLKSGASVKMTYNSSVAVNAGLYADVGKGTLEVTGGASYGYLTLVIMSTPITTEEYLCPIPYNVDVVLKNGTYDVNYGFGIMPGASLIIEPDATMNIGDSAEVSFLVYDGLYDHTSTSPAVTYGQDNAARYPTTAQLQNSGLSGTGNFIVRGTLNICEKASFGGVIQADNTTGTINVLGSNLTCTDAIGVASSKYAGRTARTLTADVLDTGTGKRTQLVTGQTYHSDASGVDTLIDYTYTLYTAEKTTETHTETLNESVYGSFWTNTATVNTVDGDGNTLSSREQKFCYGADVSQYYTEAACTTPATTITGDGAVLYAPSIASVDILKPATAGGAPVAATTYFDTLRNAVRAVDATGTVTLTADIAIDTPAMVGAGDTLNLNLDGRTVTYSVTPFINEGVMHLELNGGRVVNAAGATMSAVDNKVKGTLNLDLSGGTITVNAAADQASPLYAVANSGTMSVSDTLGTGGIYCYGPLGAAQSDWLSVQLKTTLTGNPTATVKAELYGDKRSAIPVYAGIANFATITDITGVTIRSPLFGVYSGSVSNISQCNGGTAYTKITAQSALETGAFIGSITNCTITGGRIGLMNNASAINSITDSSFKSTGSVFIGSEAVSYAGLQNFFGSIGDVSGSTFTSEDAFTLERFNITFDGSTATVGTTKISPINYGLYNYGVTYSNTGFIPTIGDIFGCTLTGMGTRISQANFDSATAVTRWTNAPNNGNGYGLRNEGGVVGNLVNDTISGNTGVRNYTLGTSATTYDTGSSSTYTYSKVVYGRVAGSGIMGNITNSTITAEYSYGLYNAGDVGAINGTTQIVANPRDTNGYALYNANMNKGGQNQYMAETYREKVGREYRTVKTVNSYTSGWNRTDLPYIETITDSVVIRSINDTKTVNYGQALYNAGYIGSITGGATIETYAEKVTGTVTTSSYALNNAGYIGAITGSVKLSASGGYALQNSGNRIQTTTTTSVYNADNTTATKDATDVVSVYSAPATIASIAGDTAGDGVVISTPANYGLSNSGQIGDITGKVTISAASYAINNAGEGVVSRLHSITPVATPEGYGEGKEFYSEEVQRFTATIGDIVGPNVTISVTATYAILNGGSIGVISNTPLSINSTSTSNGYTIYNTDISYSGYALKRYNLGKTDVINATRYITLEEKTYTGSAHGAEIEGIVGCTLTSGRPMGISNCGTIGYIRDSSITNYSSAIVNNMRYIEKSVFRYLYGTTVKAVSPAYLSDTTLAYTKARASIGEISNVTATATTTTNALQNYGDITTISGSTLTAKTGAALTNYGSVVSSYSMVYPTGTDASPAYLDWLQLNAAETGYVFYPHEFDEDMTWGHIGTIADTDITVNNFTTTSAGAVTNSGEIDNFGAGSTIGITTVGYSGNGSTYGLKNENTMPTHRHTTLADKTEDCAWLGKVAAATTDKAVTVYLRDYDFAYGENATVSGPTIHHIDGLTITTPVQYGVMNYGTIDELKNSSISAASHAIYNVPDSYYLDRTTLHVYRGKLPWATDGTSGLSQTDFTYQMGLSHIGSIDGCTISAEGNAARATKITGSYGVYNCGVVGAVTNSTITTQDAGSAGSYAYYNGTTSQKATVKSLPEGVEPTIDSMLTCLVVDGNNTKVDTTKVFPTSGLCSYTTENLGAGNVFTAGSNTVYNGSKSDLQEISGGLYIASSTSVYAVCNTATGTPVTISASGSLADGTYAGPYFKTGSGTRSYAVYSPDTSTLQTYVNSADASLPMLLSRAPLSEGEYAGCYYVQQNTFTVVFHANGGEGEDDPQFVSLLEENFTYENTFSKGKKFRLVGWASTPDGPVVYPDTDHDNSVTIPVAQLSSTIGDQIDLYAVYEQTYLFGVTWQVEGVEGVTVPDTQFTTEAGGNATPAIPAGYAITGYTITADDGTEVTVTSVGTGRNAEQGRAVSTGWESVTLNGVTKDLTVALTLKAYTYRVTWIENSAEQYVDYVPDGTAAYTWDSVKNVTPTSDHGTAAVTNEDAKTTVTVTGFTEDTTVTMISTAANMVHWKVTLGETEYTVDHVVTGASDTLDYNSDAAPWADAGWFVEQPSGTESLEGKTVEVSGNKTVAVTLHHYDYRVLYAVSGGENGLTMKPDYVDNGTALTKTGEQVLGGVHKKAFVSATVPEGSTTAIDRTPDSLRISQIEADTLVTITTSAYDYVVTVVENGVAHEKRVFLMSGAGADRAVDLNKEITSATVSPANAALSVANPASSAENAKVRFSNVTADITVSITTRHFDEVVDYRDASDNSLLARRYITGTTDTYDCAGKDNSAASLRQYVTAATGGTVDTTKGDTVTVSSLTADATVTLTLQPYAYKLVYTDNAGTEIGREFLSVEAKTLNFGNAFGLRSVATGITISPAAADANSSKTAATATPISTSAESVTISSISNDNTIKLTLVPYEYKIVMMDGETTLKTQYAKDDKDVLNHSDVGYEVVTTGENRRVITGVAGVSAGTLDGSANTNARVADGWESFVVTGLTADQTIALTFKSYDYRVIWNVTETNNGIAVITARASYMTGSSDSHTMTAGYNANLIATTGGTYQGLNTGVVTITDITKDITVTVSARNYNYAVTWVIDGVTKTKYLKFNEANEDAYTIPNDSGNVITDVVIEGDNAPTLERHNKSMRVTNISSDITITVTTGAPVGIYTSLWGDMSYQYYRNTTTYTGEGTWQPVDTYSWRHKAGSKSYRYGATTYVVPNGSILLMNDSNQIIRYTVTLDTALDWAQMIFVTDGGTVESNEENCIVVVVQPHSNVRVTSKMEGSADSLELKNQVAGTVSVETAPTE